jgi:protein O-GlcNAc transferase
VSDHKPGDADALITKARLLEQQGRADEAIRLYEDGIRQAPCLAFYVNLGALWISAKQPDLAIAPLEKAIELAPDCVPAHVNLAGANSMFGNDAEALASYRKAIELEPDNPKTLKRFAAFLGQIGRTEEAAGHYRKLLAARPSVDQFLKFGNCLMAAGRTPEAVAVYRQAVALDDQDARAHFSLANAFQELTDVSSAQQHFARGAEMEPDKPLWRFRAEVCGPVVFEDAEKIEEYLARVERAIESVAPSVDTPSPPAPRPADEGSLAADGTRSAPASLNEILEAGAFPTFGLSYLGVNTRRLKQQFAAIYEPCFRQIGNLPHGNGNRDRKRIGFLVTRRHEGIFIRCMRFEAVVLASKASIDVLKTRLAIDRLSYAAFSDNYIPAVRQVREAACDLLYYWEVGSDSLNYFLPFARLAPVQCTSHGSLATTGNRAIDYFFSSGMIESDGASEHYSERLWLSRALLMCQDRLPPVRASRGYWRLPDDRRLYGCLQNPLKLHPDFDALLAGILAADPLGTVVLLADDTDHAAAALRKRFTKRVAHADRILFMPRQSFVDYCGLLTVCDVLLDPLHYGAGSSCYDIFSFNLPLVTLPTEFMPGRVALGFYRKMQFEELVAASAEDYVCKAVQVATDRDYRHHVTGQIAARSDVLFNDIEAVREHERFFAEALHNVQ